MRSTATDTRAPADDGYISLAEAAKQLGHSAATLRVAIHRGQIPSAKKVQEGNREVWKVPATITLEDYETSPHDRLSDRQKRNIARAYKSKKKTHTELAKQYGIDPSYPRKLVERGWAD